MTSISSIPLLSNDFIDALGQIGDQQHLRTKCSTLRESLSHTQQTLKTCQSCTRRVVKVRSAAKAKRSETDQLDQQLRALHESVNRRLQNTKILSREYQSVLESAQKISARLIQESAEVTTILQRQDALKGAYQADLAAIRVHSLREREAIFSGPRKSLLRRALCTEDCIESKIPTITAVATGSKTDELIDYRAMSYHPCVSMQTEIERIVDLCNRLRFLLAKEAGHTNKCVTEHLALQRVIQRSRIYYCQPTSIEASKDTLRYKPTSSWSRAFFNLFRR